MRVEQYLLLQTEENCSQDHGDKEAYQDVEGFPDVFSCLHQHSLELGDGIARADAALGRNNPHGWRS